MKKVMLVFGTRPEAIKMAPLVREFRRHPDSFRTVVCVSGQHREMLDQVLRLFAIEPDYDLNIMRQGQDLYDVTSRRADRACATCSTRRCPDVVLVHGDTTTSDGRRTGRLLRAAIPVGHVEAGLRTHDIYSPWPEEMNRQITGRIASYHFAPTELSRRNLLGEGVDRREDSGDGQYGDRRAAYGGGADQERQGAGRPVGRRVACRRVRHGASIDGSRRMVLITGHRRENFGDGFVRICSAIKHLAETYPDVDFVYPMHLNPNVRRPIHEAFGNSSLPNLFLIEPLEYLPFVCLMERSAVVLTDSGGIQEEAPGLGKPVLVMRDTTERPEARATPERSRLVGTDYDRIVSGASARCSTDPEHYRTMSRGGRILTETGRPAAGSYGFWSKMLPAPIGRPDAGAPSWNFERAVRRAVCGR